MKEKDNICRVLLFEGRADLITQRRKSTLKLVLPGMSGISFHDSRVTKKSSTEYHMRTRISMNGNTILARVFYSRMAQLQIKALF